MPATVRMTIAVARVLREFLNDTSRCRYGYDLIQATGYSSGKLYPVLDRLVKAGWLVREREDIDPAEAGRPVRYLYRLTAHGLQLSQQELASLSEQISPPVSARNRLQQDGLGA